MEMSYNQYQQGILCLWVVILVIMEMSYNWILYKSFNLNRVQTVFTIKNSEMDWYIQGNIPFFCHYVKEPLVIHQYFLNRTNRNSEIFLPSAVSSASLSVVEATHSIPAAFSRETTKKVNVISPIT